MKKMDNLLLLKKIMDKEVEILQEAFAKYVQDPTDEKLTGLETHISRLKRQRSLFWWASSLNGDKASTVLFGWDGGGGSSGGGGASGTW